MIRKVLHARKDRREVVTDDEALYFGARLNDGTLTPGPGARLGATSLDSWLAANAGGT